jgi:hypothetical protein
MGKGTGKGRGEEKKREDSKPDSVPLTYVRIGNHSSRDPVAGILKRPVRSTAENRIAPS